MVYWIVAAICCTYIIIYSIRSPELTSYDIFKEKWYWYLPMLILVIKLMLERAKPRYAKGS